MTILANSEFLNRENLFMKDPKSDLFVILNERIYPLHKSFLTEIGYFMSEKFRNEKVHILDPNLDVLMY